MKKAIKNLISIILILSMIISGVFSISSAAVSESAVEHHFDQFEVTPSYSNNKYVPENEDGTCAYVAMSMLLSFYDYYWNDRFVPTVINSDGTTHEMGWDNGKYYSNTDELATFTAAPEYNAYTTWRNSNSGAPYSDFVNLNLNNYLHQYLISIEEDLWYQNGGALETDLGTFYWDMIAVLETYLEIQGFSEDEVTVEYLIMPDDETLFAKMEEVIGNGYPLMYCGGNDFLDLDELKFGSTGLVDEIYGHVMIAYKVENNQGEKDIKLHTGWNYNSSEGRIQWVNTTEFKYLRGIIWLEINEENLPHEHSYHYVDTVSGTPLCACQIYSGHPCHESNHVYIRNNCGYNGSFHWDTCACGKASVELENHIFNYALQMPQDNHSKTCLGCGYSAIEDHNFNTLSSIYSPTEDAHYAECACGRYGWTDHYAYSYAQSSISMHRVYCECGQLMGLAPHVLPAGALKIKFCIHCNQRVNTEDIVIRPYDAPEEIRYITDAGSYVGPDGNIYLVESDMALYLAGELDVYALVESLNAYPTV